MIGRPPVLGVRRRCVAAVSSIELLLVVSVLLILTATALPTARTLRQRAQEKQLRRSLTQIRRAIDEYHRDWSTGHIESENDLGWPEDLEELHEGKEYDPTPLGVPTTAPTGAAATTERNRRFEDLRSTRTTDPTAEPYTKIYLPRIPEDPFNVESDEWDVNGWRARAYDDEPDSTTWGGEGVHDVYSSTDRKALDGTLLAEW